MTTVDGELRELRTCGEDMKGGERQRVELVSNRENFLIQLCSDQRVVAHLGCTDSPYTRERLAEGVLLHLSLVNATTTVGFDVDAEAIELLRTTFPDQEFVCADISDGVPQEHAEAYDLVVAGEVIEHIPNMGLFLAGCRALLRPGGLLCVTVPNACSPKIGLRSLLGRERVHPDHYAYFGPRTLRRTLEAVGFEVKTMATYFGRGGRVSSVADLVLTAAHRLFKGPVGDGLICVGRQAVRVKPSV